MKWKLLSVRSYKVTFKTLGPETFFKHSPSQRTSLGMQWVKPLPFQCRGRGFDPWSGKFHKPWGVDKNKNTVPVTCVMLSTQATQH